MATEKERAELDQTTTLVTGMLPPIPKEWLGSWRMLGVDTGDCDLCEQEELRGFTFLAEEYKIRICLGCLKAAVRWLGDDEKEKKGA